MPEPGFQADDNPCAEINMVETRTGREIYLEECLHQSNVMTMKIIDHILHSYGDPRGVDTDYILSVVGFSREGEPGYKEEPYA